MSPAARDEGQGFFARASDALGRRRIEGKAIEVYCFGDVLEMRGKGGGG